MWRFSPYLSFSTMGRKTLDTCPCNFIGNFQYGHQDNRQATDWAQHICELFVM